MPQFTVFILLVLASRILDLEQRDGAYHTDHLFEVHELRIPNVSELWMLPGTEEMYRSIQGQHKIGHFPTIMTNEYQHIFCNFS